MRILLVNDTSASRNPGCKAAVSGIRRAYGARHGPLELRSLPLGYWAEPFQPLAARPRDCVERRPPAFPWPRPEAPALERGRWRELVRELGRADQELAGELERAELVVINGEGSIHHHLPRALALLGLARWAIERGRPVHLVNCTLYALDPGLLREALEGARLLHVREPESLALLERAGLAASWTIDLACLAFEEWLPAEPPARDPTRQGALVSAGVTADEVSLAAILEAARAGRRRATYLSMGDGGERALSERLCAARGTECVPAEALALEELLAWLRAFALAVSGRHHLDLMLALAGVPFVPLPSNTSKAAASLAALDYPLAVVRDADELARALAWLEREPERFAGATWQAGRRALASARTFVAGLPD